MQGISISSGNGAAAKPPLLVIRIELAGAVPSPRGADHELAPDAADCLECRLSLRESAFFRGAKDDTTNVTVTDLFAAAGARSDEYTYRGPDHPDFSLTCIEPWDGKLPRPMRELTSEGALIDAIRRAPDDARLASRFALWLEENDDPRGEHIRVQLAMEDYPPGAERWDEDYQALLKRDCELQHSYPWGKQLAMLQASGDFRPIFRRGLVQTAMVKAQPFLFQPNVLRRQCPLLRRLEIEEARGQGEDLGKMAALAGVPEVALVGWVTGPDARALAASPHLGELETLEIWLGSLHDHEVIDAVAQLPGLKRLVLRQLHGGVQAGKQARRLNRRADDLAARANHRHGSAIAVVNRPWERAFRLSHLVGFGFFAGQLASGQQVLIVHREKDRTLLLHSFDADGRFQECHEHAARRTPPADDGDYINPRFLSYLKRTFGFELAEIRVKEFQAPSGVGVYLFDRHELGFLAAPDTRPVLEYDDDADACSCVHDWLKEGHFVIADRGQEYAVDRSGRIFSWPTPPGT